MKGRLQINILILVLIIINIIFVFPGFKGEFTSFPLSIESVFITDAKFFITNFPNVFWYPFWYFGLPFYLVYQPLPIVLTGFLSLFPGISVSHSYRILTSIFLSLSVIGFYKWSLFLTKDKLSSFVGGVVYTLVPSIAYIFLSPSWSGYGFIPLSFVNTWVYGEGPHMWGLALIPFASLYFQKLLRKPQERVDWICAVMLTSIILLTSLTAFVGLVVFYFFIFWYELAKETSVKKMYTAVVLLLFTFGLCFFWYNPEFFKAAFGYSLGEGGGIFSGVWGNFVFTLFALPTSLFLLYLTFSLLLKESLVKYRNVVLPTIIFVFLYLVIYAWFKFDSALFPLPFNTIPRLIPELELSFALLIASILTLLAKKIKYLLSGVVIITILIFGFTQKENFWDITKPNSDFSLTSEYLISNKLNELSAKQVYATGTHAFWLNLFSDAVQLRGGKGGDFGGLNPWWSHLSYLINKNDEKDLTLKWMRSLGFQYIVVNYPGSMVYYHDYENMSRFSDFEEVYNYAGDKILKVPTRNTSFALAVPKGWMKDFTLPKDASSGEIVLDENFVNEYFNNIDLKERPIKTEYPSDNWSKITIPVGQLKNDEEILIRKSYYPGWTAFSNGKRLKLEKDPIGFMRLEEPGLDEIALEFVPRRLILPVLLSLSAFIVFVDFLRKKRFNK